mmetsp:Transcript_27187/g.78125  ORF Transcript_27187/g.78125 Transcript_27187/m.78125 type:complete len:380 (+) Transcript_27187:55-1194(+)
MPTEAMSSQSSAMHEIGAKRQVECIKATSSSSSNTCPISEAPSPAPVVDNCQTGSDCDDSASTAASDVGERWADFADSDEGDDAHDEQPGVGSSSTGAGAAAAARRSPAPPSAPKEKDVEAVSQAAARWKVQKSSTLVAQRTSKYSEAKLEPKQHKWGGKRSAVWGELDAPKCPSSQTRSAAKWAGGKAPASQNGDAWWAEQQWSQDGSEWWGSKDAEWWSSKGPQKDWWSQQQQQQYSSWNAPRLQQADRRGAVAGSAKPQCQFFIGIEEDSKFKVTRKVLGPHGQHMKSIAEASGAKLRLRGKGSGFLEGPEQRESTDELMLCVSAPDQAGYDEAVKMVRELMERVYDEYRTFCRKSGKEEPDLQIRVHEGPRPGSR